MTFQYDKIADALYVLVSQRPIHHTQELSDTIMVDLDDEGKIAGIEVLEASRMLNLARYAIVEGVSGA